MSEVTKGTQLVAVVVTYNRLSQLKKTLTRLLQENVSALHHVIVVDNASTDGSADWLDAQSDPRLTVYKMTHNTGGAGGFAFGMKKAMEEHNADWAVVLDDDARPYQGAFDQFHALDKSGWDGFAAAVYYPDGRICEMNRPSRNPFWSLRTFVQTTRKGRGGFHLNHSDYSDTGVVLVDVTSFVGFFISREGVEKAGYPDPDLFVYADDGIYTLGLRKAGGRIGFVPWIRFEHDLTTFQGDKNRFKAMWKVYYYHRNLLILYRNAAGPWFWPVLPLILGKWFSKVRYYENDKRLFLKLLTMAVQDGLLRRKSRTHASVLNIAGDS
ncbi:glycosyltransferase [Pseudaestuariivita rosea]|uniref:glycosyltransferase n=1 Tax=Pseudaestuariivita rosea TaxID=2763263 RepID=UPI003013FC94